MNKGSKFLAGFVALQHVLFMVVEMFFWQSELVMKRLNMTEEQAKHTARLAVNQGLYNGFLAAGLIWALFFIKDARQARAARIFFFGCVAAAGVLGGVTVKPSIFFIQGVPALIGLGLTLASKPEAE